MPSREERRTKFNGGTKTSFYPILEPGWVVKQS